MQLNFNYTGLKKKYENCYYKYQKRNVGNKICDEKYGPKI